VPEGDDEAPALTAALAGREVDARPAVWDDQSVDWAAFDLVVVRSTWDYPGRREQFLAWAESLPFVLNPPDVLRWNTDKRYLDALQTDAVPSTFLPPGAAFEPPAGQFIVKPSVGAGSIGAARYEAGDDRALGHVAELHAAGKTVLIQPYLSAVDTAGETSLIYLGGTYSHTVRKEPLLEHGSEPGSGLYLEETIASAEPTAVELEVAERALAAVPFARGDLLYARIDLIGADDGRPLVLEVELTEPSLFIGYADGAAERFAAAIVASL
jgi:glutathione synthase/RimK-type ligase-like ATP-grasp enzyme